MKKYRKFLCLFFIVFSFFVLSGCSSANDETDSKNNQVTETVKEEPKEITVVVSADFTDNFKVDISTVYGETSGSLTFAYLDVTITKKSKFTLRNTFSLYLEYKSGSKTYPVLANKKEIPISNEFFGTSMSVKKKYASWHNPGDSFTGKTILYNIKDVY